jgi:hypothetical protein
MRARVLLWFSVGMNVLLAGMIFFLAQDSERVATTADFFVHGGRTGAVQVKTNVVLRRQFFTWSEVESPDYPTFIANLRRIAMPEKTIRDIVVADVNDVFAARLARELNLPEQKWWLPEPEMDAFEAAMNQIRAIEAEKNATLTQLLGPGWEASRNNVSANLVRFDGPVLNSLSAEAKMQVQQIEAQQRRAINEAVDPAERSRLQAETRAQLAAILTPQQLEEYLLRYSDTAEQMRAQLRGFGADAEEFRRIFRARDPFDQQIAALAGDDPTAQRRRAELERSRDEAIRQTLGPERASFYAVTQSPLFQQAREQAEQSGAPPEKVLPLFEIKRAVQDEVTRIANDRSLSEDQRRVALAAIEQQHQNSVNRVLAGATAEPLPAQAPAPAVIEVPFPPGFFLRPRPVR